MLTWLIWAGKKSVFTCIESCLGIPMGDKNCQFPHWTLYILVLAEHFVWVDLNHWVYLNHIGGAFVCIVEHLFACNSFNGREIRTTLAESLIDIYSFNSSGENNSSREFWLTFITFLFMQIVIGRRVVAALFLSVYFLQVQSVCWPKRIDIAI